ncbi:hypothetical protein HWV62_9287 [Athelia sp. TMB]|nr:hypothetical protein HWV62_9287 [Athelia sp. TMB]
MKFSKQPSTPARNFFSFLKPSNLKALRKRDLYMHDTASSDDAAAPAPHIHSSPAVSSGLKRSNSIALQNEDADMDETVIVTTLDSAPFCCHEDLVNMNRAQLIDVATSLNEKLPGALRIEIHASTTDRYIRNAIELIVGITKAAPATPKAPKRSAMGTDEPDMSATPSPPSSPLARKLCRRGSQPAPARLEALKEEDEDAVAKMDRGDCKKRRHSTEVAESPIVKKRRIVSQPRAPARRARKAHGASSNQRPSLGRTQSLSQRVPASQISPPRSYRVLRSHSQKLPAEMKLMDIDTAFVTIRRPRYRFQATSTKSSGGITGMSTPQQPSVARDGFQMRDDSSEKAKSSASMLSITSPVAFTSGHDLALSEDDAPLDMTFGLDEMTLGSMIRSDSDMDIDTSL